MRKELIQAQNFSTHVPAFWRVTGFQDELFQTLASLKWKVRPNKGKTCVSTESQSWTPRPPNGRVMLACGEFVSLVTRKAKTGLATGQWGLQCVLPVPWDCEMSFQAPSELARVWRICGQDKQHQDLGWSVWIPAPVPFSCHRFKIKLEVLARFQGLFLRQTQYTQLLQTLFESA